MAGHIFNWEWFVGLAPNLYTEKTVAVYHKVKNNFWNERINQIRGKFGTIPLDMKSTPRYMMSTPNNGEHTYLFVADQSPKKSAIHYSLNFLNQETPVFVGFDKIAIKKEMAVIFCKMTKIKQGYYHTTFERILPEGENYEPMEIVHKFFENLEETIKENPDNWLWSHKRWKYKKGIDY
jgi:KDO2-lipid IV(A) lauroyltransferase